MLTGDGYTRRRDLNSLSNDCDSIVSMVFFHTGTVVSSAQLNLSLREWPCPNNDGISSQLYDPREFVLHPVTRKIRLPPIQNVNILLDPSTSPNTTYLYREAIRVRIADALTKFIFSPLYASHDVKQSAEKVLDHLSKHDDRSTITFRSLMLGLTNIDDDDVRDSVVEPALDSIYQWFLPLVPPAKRVDSKDRLQALFRRAFEIWCRALKSKDRISAELVSDAPNPVCNGNDSGPECDEPGSNSERPIDATQAPASWSGFVIASSFHGYSMKQAKYYTQESVFTTIKRIWLSRQGKRFPWHLRSNGSNNIARGPRSHQRRHKTVDWI